MLFNVNLLILVILMDVMTLGSRTPLNIMQVQARWINGGYLARQIPIPPSPASPAQFYPSFYLVGSCFVIPTLKCFCCITLPLGLGIGSQVSSLLPTKIVTSTTTSTTTCTSAAPLSNCEVVVQRRELSHLPAGEDISEQMITPSRVEVLEMTTLYEPERHLVGVSAQSSFPDIGSHSLTEKYDDIIQLLLHNYNRQLPFGGFGTSLLAPFNVLISTIFPVASQISSFINMFRVTETSTVLAIATVTSNPVCSSKTGFAQCPHSG